MNALNAPDLTTAPAASTPCPRCGSTAPDEDTSFALGIAAMLDDLRAFEAERALWAEQAEKQAAFEAERDACARDLNPSLT